MPPVLERDDIALFLLDLPLDLEGYSFFLNSWILWDREREWTLLVDPGPSSTMEALLAGMDQSGCPEPDMILLTHIHMDHSGVAGYLSERFPQVPFLVSEKGIRHLAHPRKLWESSLATLGEKAMKYGPPKPVPVKNLRMEGLEIPEFLSIIETPGHASHHRSYLYRDILFCGEAGGVHLPWDESVFQGMNQYTDVSIPYLRPATPPPFDLAVTLDSLSRLMELKTSSILCYSHYGFSDEPLRMLASHRDQLLLWEKIIGNYPLNGDKSVIHDEGELCRCVLEHVLERDPRLAGFDLLSKDIRNREEYFLLNSIRGFVQALRDS